MAESAKTPHIEKPQLRPGPGPSAQDALARVRPPPRRGSQEWCMVDAGNRPTPPARARHQAMIRTTVYRVHPGPLRWAQFLAHIAGTHRYQWNWAIERLQDAMRTEREGRGEKPSINSSRLGLEFTEALGPGFQS